MIDALLAEFLPSNPHQRRQPPDLSEQILAQLAACSDSIAANERVGENLPVAAAASDGARADSATAGSMLPASSSTLTRMVSLLVAVAATIVGVMWLAGNDSVEQQPTATTTLRNHTGKQPIDQRSNRTAPEQPGEQLASQDPASLGDGEGSQRPSEKPIRGTVLDPPRLADNDPAGDSKAPSPTPSSESPQQAASMDQMLASTTETAQRYWRDLGVTPTPAAPADQVAARLKARLGVELPTEALSDPERLRNELANEKTAREIAKRWLAVTANAGVGQVDRPENAPLIGRLAQGVAGQSRWDTTLVSLIDGSGPHADRWYETIGRGGTEAIAKRLAGISMNADVRCIKCHDSMIGRAGTQDDYWSFVALVRNVFERTEDRWVIRDTPKAIQTFFELPDGRQRLASPKISRHLLETADEIDNFERWTATLRDSGALASSMVDSLWQLVHGRKLKPSPVDAFAPPINQNLQRLHRQLAEDLAASGFDVARTLALIIASPMANRSVPEALRGSNVLTAAESDRSEALERVAAFAASVQPPNSSQKDRVDLVMRRIGGQLQSDDQDTVLAQPVFNPPSLKPSGSAGNRGQALSFSEQLGVDFPSDNAPLPVSWLRSIDHFDQQVQHLAYLSGRERVTPEIEAIAKRLKDAGSTQSALSRLWWILRP